MAGKSLSRKTTKSLKAAHALLSKVLAKADPDDLAAPVDPSVLAGPDGTQGENAPDPTGSMDMTGSRSDRRLVYSLPGQPDDGDGFRRLVYRLHSPSFQRGPGGDMEVR